MKARILTLSVAFLAFASARSPAMPSEKEMAIEAVKKLGGNVVLDKTQPDKPVAEVWLRRVANDIELAHLKGLTKIKLLRIGDSKVTDAGLAHLKAFPTLETLGIGGTRITDAGLAYLSALTKLTWLDLDNTKVTSPPNNAGPQSSPSANHLNFA